MEDVLLQIAAVTLAVAAALVFALMAWVGQRQG
jgi:hypothetical protein